MREDHTYPSSWACRDAATSSVRPGGINKVAPPSTSTRDALTEAVAELAADILLAARAARQNRDEVQQLAQSVLQVAELLQQP